MNYVCVKANIGDGIGFVIFVIIIIVVNVLKKIRSTQESKSEGEPASPRDAAPQDKLNAFLKSITQVQKPAQPAAAQPRKTQPPPMQQASVTAVAPPPVAAARRKKSVRPASSPQVPQPAPVYAASSVAASAGTARRTTVGPPTVSSIGASVPARMGLNMEDSQALRQAIIVREILGPPIALRRDQAGSAR